MFKIMNDLINHKERFNLNAVGMLIKDMALVPGYKSKVITFIK